MLSYKNFFHGKFVLKRECYCKIHINKYETRLVVCSYKEVKNEEASYSPLSEFSIIKLAISIVK